MVRSFDVLLSGQSPVVRGQGSEQGDQTQQPILQVPRMRPHLVNTDGGMFESTRGAPSQWGF